MALNSRPDRFVRKCDGPIREHGVALLQTKLAHKFILANRFARATPFFRTGLFAGIIIKSEGRRRNREQRAVLPHDKFGVFGIASIIDFRDGVHGFELSYDAITVWIVRIGIYSIVLVGILLPPIPIGESKVLFVI